MSENRYYRRRFGQIVAELADDPEFARQVAALAPPDRRSRRTSAVLLWCATPWLFVLGGWAGLAAAVAVGGLGALLWHPAERPLTRASGPARR
jgi:hypothetical protein